MQLIYWFNLFLHLFSETKRALLGQRNVGAMLTHLLGEETFLSWLEREHSDLYFQLINEVVTAKELVQTHQGEVKALEAEQDELTVEFHNACGTLKAKSSWLEQEVSGGLKSTVTTLTRPINRIMEEGQRRFLFLKAEKQHKYLQWISAGLAIPNFIAFSELLNISLHQLTLQTLIFVPLILAFSMSASVGVHIGLSDFIKATRDYIVRGDRPLSANMFPYGWRDKALAFSVVIVVCDALFSSVGLLMALPPNLRDQLFWQMAILAVSAFASVVNVLLAWGVAQYQIALDLRMKHEGAVQQESIKEHEQVIQVALVSKAKLENLKGRMVRERAKLLDASRAAKISYNRWFKELRSRQREQRIMERRVAILAGNTRYPQPIISEAEPVAQLPAAKSNGHSKKLTLPLDT